MEPSHQQILLSIQALGEETRVAHAKLAGKMEGRFDGIDRELAGIRSQLSSTDGRVTVLEDDRGHPVPRSVEVIEEGLPFSKGWARNLGLAAIVIAALDGLKVALGTLVQAGHALSEALASFLQTQQPPGH